MPGPFPGMDPWLESPAVFPDFHTRFLNEFSAALNTVLPPPFYSGVSTRVWLERSEEWIGPDVIVPAPTRSLGGDPGGRGSCRAAGHIQRLVDGVGPGGTHEVVGGSAGASPSRNGPTAIRVAELTAGLLEIVDPFRVGEERRENYVEVYAAPGGERLVASVELLSPSNKTPGSGGRDLYRAKQQEMVRGGVHLVEIDLLRGGTHATLVPTHLLRARVGAYDYHVCLHYAEARVGEYVDPVRLADRLPAVRVPLTADVPAVRVDAQAVFDRCYDVGLYGRRVRYGEPPDPPLTAEQQAWAAGVLRERGVI